MNIIQQRTRSNRSDILNVFTLPSAKPSTILEGPEGLQRWHTKLEFLSHRYGSCKTQTKSHFNLSGIIKYSLSQSRPIVEYSMSKKVIHQAPQWATVKNTSWNWSGILKIQCRTQSNIYRIGSMALFSQCRQTTAVEYSLGSRRSDGAFPEVGQGRGWSQSLRNPKDTTVLDSHFHNLKAKKFIQKNVFFCMKTFVEGLLEGLEGRSWSQNVGPKYLGATLTKFQTATFCHSLATVYL